MTRSAEEQHFGDERTSWWLESNVGNPRVGWREYVDDPLTAAAEAAAELGKPITIHSQDCKRGTGIDPFAGGSCTCAPRVVQPGGRAPS